MRKRRTSRFADGVQRGRLSSLTTRAEGRVVRCAVNALHSNAPLQTQSTQFKVHVVFFHWKACDINSEDFYDKVNSFESQKYSSHCFKEGIKTA